MFYEMKKNDHGLARDPFKSCVVPRPIGWISTIDSGGVSNLAPYSQFQNLTFDPPYIMFSANQRTTGKRKDTVVNTEETGEFVYNMVTYDLRKAMNKTAEQVDPDQDEFEIAGLTKAPSMIVKPYRVSESPINLECRHHQTIRLPGKGKMGTVDVVIGEVLAVHIKDEFIMEDGKLDILKIRPIGRLGYYDYTIVDTIFDMDIPGTDEDVRTGMEGAANKLR